MVNDQKCYLCGNEHIKQRDGKVRDNDLLKILECQNCGLVFLSSFDHIDASFYQDSKMHPSKEDDLNFKSWQNETEWDDERRYQSLKPSLVNKSILDFGSGTGGFLQKAKKVASKTVGIELEKRVVNHYKKNNIQLHSSINDIGSEKFDLITLFHVLEHLPDPKKILKELANQLTPEKGVIHIEVPNASDALITLFENKPFSEFTYWSCHLYLYNAKTLELLASQCGLKIIYTKQIQRYPLSNHLYWLAKGKPGGHSLWNFLDSTELHANYEKQLASIGACDTVITGFSLHL